MNGEQKFYVAIVAVIGITIILFTLTIVTFCYKRQAKFVDNGYTRKALVGMPTCQWVKIDDSNSINERK